MSQQVVIFTNSNSETIKFNNDRPFVFSGISGVSATTATNNSSTTAYRDGEFYQYSTIDKKQMVLKGLIVAKTQKNYMLYRRQLISLFNPKLGEGILTYITNGTTRKIKCVADGFPDLPIKRKDKNTAFEIVLLAFNPFFYDDSKTANFSTVSGGLHFPLAITSEGTHAGYRKIETSKILENSGDTECGLIATFTATGGNVTTEILQNITNSETITTNVALEVGEQLIIDTRYGFKSIKKICTDGIETNEIGNLYIPSDFIKLEIGENYISYDNGSNNMALSIEYLPLYLGV